MVRCPGEKNPKNVVLAEHSQGQAGVSEGRHKNAVVDMGERFVIGFRLGSDLRDLEESVDC